MLKVIILGSGPALPGPGQDYAQLLLLGQQHSLLIDCGSNPFQKFQAFGLAASVPTDLIVTHFHPDHIAGYSTLLLSCWLAGRQNSLNVHGLEYTVTRMKAMMELYDTHDWPGMFAIEYNQISSDDQSRVLNYDEFSVLSWSVKHVIPNIGLRIESTETGKVLAYTSDTEPCPQVSQLAQGAEILIHEATGNHDWHTSAAQAGIVANRAGVKELYLIHYSAEGQEKKDMINSARKNFAGPIFLAEENMALDL